jgi:hypothetical protein
VIPNRPHLNSLFNCIATAIRVYATSPPKKTPKTCARKRIPKFERKMASVNKPTDVKAKEADINRKLQVYGIFTAFSMGKVPSVRSHSWFQARYPRFVINELFFHRMSKSMLP